MAAFFFYYSLTDFLSSKEKQNWIRQTVPFSSSVKDAIEAFGVPHVEVMKIMVNGHDKDFTYQVQPEDAIEVYPFTTQPAPERFILDVQLGKLARLLRMLGIDSLYQNHYTEKEIVNLAVEENRTVLTRDTGLLKHKVLQYGYWLRSQQPERQLEEVVQYFSLCHAIKPFSLCLDCNGHLQTVPKKTVVHALPQQTKEFFNEFYQCAGCRKVYWKGSHYKNMQRLVEWIKSIAC